MTAKQMLSLNVGDSFLYAGQEVKIIGWNTFLEPQFNRANERIDAEPLVQFPNGRKSIVSWLYWGECLTKAEQKGQVAR